MDHLFEPNRSDGALRWSEAVDDWPEPALAEIHHVKPNVLLLGPSGVGKTHLMRALAKV